MNLIIYNYFLVKIGEMELSPIAYWAVVLTLISFVITFILSTIPLANNIKNKQKDRKDN